MKTQIIKLEAHDDLISIRDKMGWGKTGRILLVWPKNGQVLLNRLELTLLQRHSQTLGAQLGLVTRDGEVRQHARELGIPIHKNLRQAQQAIWRSPRHIRREQSWRAMQLRLGRETGPRLDLRTEKPARPTQALPWPVRWIVFALGVLAVLAIGALLAPSAELRLHPATQVQQIELAVTADPQATRISLAGIVPAHLTSVVVEGRDQLIVSGTATLPDQPAGGLVTFTNLSDREVAIPAGLVVLTIDQPVVRFATTRDGSAPPGPGATLSLPVRALQAGEIGNVAAGEIQAIEGALGIELSVTNPRAFSGGRDLTSLAPDPGDYTRLSTRLGESLRQTALHELISALEPGDVLIEDSLQLSRTLEEIFQPAEIQPADELILNLRLEFSALITRQADLSDLAESVLNASNPQGFTPQMGSLVLTRLDEPEMKPDGRATWPMLAVRNIQPVIAPVKAIQLVLGLEPEAARQKLEQGLALDDAPEISLSPAWWPRLPMLPFRIYVESTP